MEILVIGLAATLCVLTWLLYRLVAAMVKS
jgi:hypothetical protein